MEQYLLNDLYETKITQLENDLLEFKIQLKILNKQISMMNNTIEMNNLY